MSVGAANQLSTSEVRETKKNYLLSLQMKFRVALLVISVLAFPAFASESGSNDEWESEAESEPESDSGSDASDADETDPVVDRCHSYRLVATEKCACREHVCLNNRIFLKFRGGRRLLAMTDGWAPALKRMRVPADPA